MADDGEPRLWPISVEGMWGYIDAKGVVRVTPQYASASPFREGLALVSVLGTSEMDQVFGRNYDGFIDVSGQFVIPAELPTFFANCHEDRFYGYSSFEDGVAIVYDASRSDGLKGLIDRQGRLLAPMVFRHLDLSCGEGLCEFRTDTDRGYMDYYGKAVIRPEEFLYGTGFSEGRAVITVRKQDGDHQLLINRDGDVIVGPGEYTGISRVQGGLARVVKGGAVGLIDRDGQVIVPLGEYSQILEPDPGTAYIGEKDGAFYSLRSATPPVKLPAFDATPIRYRRDLIWIQTENGHDGFATADGRIVVEPIYDDLSYGFDGQLCWFRRGVEVGYINRADMVVWSSGAWEPSLRYSLREPLQSLLPTFGVEAMPLFYNWDCENAIVFVCSGRLERLREHFLAIHSETVRVTDYTDYELEPGKLNLKLAFEGVAYVEVIAMRGDQESGDPADADSLVNFYVCEAMAALRKKWPGNTIGVMFEN